MKNKLLVSVFAMVIASLAFTSCESKSDVMEVCDDLMKATLHKSARSLEQLDGQNLSITEFEFLGGVNDDRLALRTIAFGNGSYQAKKVDTLHYEYGDWNEAHTVYYLLVTPPTGETYTLAYMGNALITSDGTAIGGEGTDNTARVEKWEKVIGSLPNTAWEAQYKGEYVVDSIFRDSIRVTFIPPMTFLYDTIQIFDHLDTISADTTCLFHYEFRRDAATMANTGRLYKKGIRSTYNRETKQAEIQIETETEVAFDWFFSTVGSDSKFTLTAISKTKGASDEKLSISKYKLDDQGKPMELFLGNLTYTPVVLP